MKPQEIAAVKKILKKRLNISEYLDLNKIFSLELIGIYKEGYPPYADAKELAKQIDMNWEEISDKLDKKLLKKDSDCLLLVEKHWYLILLLSNKGYRKGGPKVEEIIDEVKSKLLTKLEKGAIQRPFDFSRNFKKYLEKVIKNIILSFHDKSTIKNKTSLDQINDQLMETIKKDNHSNEFQRLSRSLNALEMLPSFPTHVKRFNNYIRSLRSTERSIVLFYCWLTMASYAIDETYIKNLNRNDLLRCTFEDFLRKLFPAKHIGQEFAEMVQREFGIKFLQETVESRCLHIGNSFEYLFGKKNKEKGASVKARGRVLDKVKIALELTDEEQLLIFVKDKTNIKPYINAVIKAYFKDFFIKN